MAQHSSLTRSLSTYASASSRTLAGQRAVARGSRRVRLRRLWDAISLAGTPGPHEGTGPAVGIYLGWGSLGPVRARPDEHVLVIGPPRSGKTTRLVAPALLSHPGPAVVTSTKADIFAMTAEQRRRLGPLWCWSPGASVPDGARQLRWSPLSGCGKWTTPWPGHARWPAPPGRTWAGTTRTGWSRPRPCWHRRRTRRSSSS